MILSIGVVLVIISLLSFVVVDGFGKCLPERKMKIITALAILGIILMAIGVGFSV
jgi:hypothetical protein